MGAARAEIVKAGPSGHPHLNPNAVVAGDYHVINVMDRRTGRLGIQVLDRHEEPYLLERASIKAIVWHDGQGLIPNVDNGQYYGGRRGATLYTDHFDWVKEEHDVHFKVWVPLPDGKTYEIAFACSAREALPSHSGIDR